MDEPVFTVAVTGLNAIDSPGSGVGVIRSLRDAEDFKVRIIGLVYESLEPGVYMEGIADRCYMIPYPSAGREALLADKFEMLDKMHLHEFGAAHDFDVPKTRFISSKAQAEDIEDDFEYPLVVKGKFYEAYIAHNRGQVLSYFDKLNAKWGLPVIIQEFVKGTEIDIAGLGDGKGKLMGAVPMRKLYITDKGKAWSGIVIDDPELLRLTRRFVRESRWTGGFELEIMRTKDNRNFIMEVNPRFPAWIYTTAAAGQNLPAALVRLVMGLEAKPYKSYRTGTMFVRYAWDNITHISEFEKISNYGER
ncbi:MAG: ATP-grasp domain-containing protein [Cyclobacteriaceae bacterium]